jgi:thiol-disulfide isomerase/thioredoxin
MNTMNTISPTITGSSSGSSSSSSSMKVSLLHVTNKSTSDKLEKIRARKNHHIITLFYRDGCPPCDKMKPEWKKACETFKQKYACKDKNAKERTVIANVDDKGIKYLDKVFHKIQGTPTILYMSDNNIREYNENDRTAPTFLKWFEETLKDEIVPANVHAYDDNDNDNNNTRTSSSRSKTKKIGGKVKSSRSNRSKKTARSRRRRR